MKRVRYGAPGLWAGIETECFDPTHAMKPHEWGTHYVAVGREVGSMEIAVSTAKNDPKRRALGKGLESLLPTKAVAPVVAEPVAAKVVEGPAGRPLEIELNKIDRNPMQTRTTFDPEKLQELARSIEASGVVQPIVVRALQEGRYQLITGERRWLASFEAKKTHIPAIVREVSDVQAMEMTIVENLQRADLNPMEQARAYQRLSDDFKMSQQDMATRTGMPRATVANYIRLTRLPKAVQGAVEAGSLSFGHAKALLALEGDEMITGAAQKILSLSMSVRQTETFVSGLLNPELKERAEKAVAPLDANVKDIRDRIQQRLGLKVNIEDHKGRGKIVIEYSRLSDFDGILEAMGL